ncbi:WD domain G-beta repeat domain containing protein [Plasmodium malariae]|uniref:WD domain G-beta repeat domain containing protein n=1 Tax=Plasmodium malariae TaxID=5858 RepID=A0A1A8VTP9_PLAMA|nr:WD domain G-beta repeat domain containing protein [Plasmodium malariae]
MKSNTLEKKKKKKVQGLSEAPKGAETESKENEIRKTSIQNNKNETFTRFLFPKNPRAFNNLIEFSFSNEQFVPVDHIDHTVFHLDLKSCLIRKDSDEGKKQIDIIKKKIEKANHFTFLNGNGYRYAYCIYHKSKNCFDYVDRYTQTVPKLFKYAAV